MPVLIGFAGDATHMVFLLWSLHQSLIVAQALHVKQVSRLVWHQDHHTDIYAETVKEEEIKVVVVSDDRTSI